MQDTNHILKQIADSVRTTDPGATLILFGSYARGDQRPDSDMDILVLLETDRITWDDRKRISSPLYAIELETGIMISPRLYSKKAWASHRVTPFYENVINDGKPL